MYANMPTATTVPRTTAPNAAHRPGDDRRHGSRTESSTARAIPH